MKIIDAHIHYVGDHPDALALLERLDLKLLNICVAHGTGGVWREHAHVFQALARRYPEHYRWCTTFNPPNVEAGDMDHPLDYADAVITDLEADFASQGPGGAVGCKIWKNIGMEIRTSKGEFLMVDDPIFEPIYEHLASVGKPVIMHTGEPRACWEPLDENNVHAGYYGSHPEWYMGDKPEYPSHTEIIAARDRVLARHPDLRVVGAHLGSLEYDVEALAQRLARYHNFAVDTSARLRDLAVQESEAVRDTILAYPDRILFGTDVVQREPVSQMDEAARAAHLAAMAKRYESDLAYYQSDGMVEVNGRSVQGLGLPTKILEKLFYANAEAWFPGL